jgi:hypothetical protein
VRYLVVALALGLAVGPAEPVAAQQVRSGVLTCDVSAGMGCHSACNFNPLMEWVKFGSRLTCSPRDSGQHHRGRAGATCDRGLLLLQMLVEVLDRPTAVACAVLGHRALRVC